MLVLGLPVGQKFVFCCPSDETKKAVLTWVKQKGRKPRFLVDDPHGLLKREAIGDPPQAKMVD